MFGFSWGEIAIIMAVALIAIGPKDMPVAIRTVTGLIRKARGLAAEFQGHIDEMMREANVTDVVDDLKDIKRSAALHRSIPAGLARSLDPGGVLKGTAGEAGEMAPAMPRAAPEPEPDAPDAPRFIPPEAARRAPMPAFIPPGTKRWGF